VLTVFDQKAERKRTQARVGRLKRFYQIPTCFQIGRLSPDYSACEDITWTHGITPGIAPIEHINLFLRKDLVTMEEWQTLEQSRAAPRCGTTRETPKSA
jgi:hypothetical protein